MAAGVEPAERTYLNSSVAYIRRLVGSRSCMFYKTQQQQNIIEIIRKVDCSTCFCTNNYIITGSHTIEMSEISIEESYPYVGLEIAGSITRLNCLKDYWSSKTFCGQEDFRKITGRDMFLNIQP